MRCTAPNHFNTPGGLKPCNQCIECRLNRRDLWTTRCLLESRHSSTGQFWTLTFSDEGLDTLGTVGLPQLAKRFFDAFRKSEARGGNRTKIRFFGALEHGELRDRPHLHLLIWNHVRNLMNETPYRDGLPRPRFTTGLWPHGHVDIQPLNPNSARYVCKYVTKFETDPDRVSVFHARNPPLGYHGLERLVLEHSSSPTRQHELLPTISLDGKDWGLDQSMRSAYWHFCRKYGVRALNDTDAKRTALRLEKVNLENAWTMQDFEKRERAHLKLHEGLARGTAKRQARQFSVWSRALALSTISPAAPTTADRAA